MLSAFLVGLLVCASLAAVPSLTRKDAVNLALREVPKGRVLSAEREKEGGKEIWSLDVQSSDRKHVFELQYEVSTGKLVSRKEESKEEQRKETERDRKKTQ